MFSHLTAVLLALVVGFAAGVLQADVRPPAPLPTPPATTGAPAPAPLPEAPPARPDRPGADAALHELAQRLQAEVEARRALEGRLSELQDQVQTLAAEVATISEPVQQQPADAVPEPPPTLDEARLMEAGLSTDVIATLRRLVDDLAMEQLNLDDRAQREGWINTPRYFRERRELNNGVLAMRDQVGDTAFDHLLHAMGRPNRVAVQSVVGGSAAEQVGLRPGDQVIGYAGRRVYSGRELQQATREGERGETVSLEVSRDGSSVLFYLPRGPIGIRMESRTVAP